MNINPLNFVSEVPGSAKDITQTFFWLDEDNRGAINLFSLIRSNKKEKAATKAVAQYEMMITGQTNRQSVCGLIMGWLMNSCENG